MLETDEEVKARLEKEKEISGKVEDKKVTGQGDKDLVKDKKDGNEDVSMENDDKKG